MSPNLFPIQFNAITPCGNIGRLFVAHIRTATDNAPILAFADYLGDDSSVQYIRGMCNLAAGSSRSTRCWNVYMNLLITSQPRGCAAEGGPDVGTAQ